MIGIDTSSFIAYLAGDGGHDVEQVKMAFQNNLAVLPPPVVSELLSDPCLPVHIEKLVISLPQLDTTSGYWERVGRLRRKLLGLRKRARLADVLIAQCCIDHRVALITRDRDFNVIARNCDLRIA